MSRATDPQRMAKEFSPPGRGRPRKVSAEWLLKEASDTPNVWIRITCDESDASSYSRQIKRYTKKVEGYYYEVSVASSAVADKKDVYVRCVGRPL